MAAQLIVKRDELGATQQPFCLLLYIFKQALDLQGNISFSTSGDTFAMQMVKEKLEILGKAGLNGTNFNDTESHVVKKREENNLLHYFQVSTFDD